MPGYFGTEEQQRLQAQAEANADFISATPGACQGGRMMSCDAPDRLGWDKIEAFLERDGVCGFRLISRDQIDTIESNLAARDCRFDTWDVFLADRKTALPASEDIISRVLRDGIVETDRPSDPESEFVRQLQALMGTSGIVPFSGSLLVGACGPAATVSVGDRQGNIVAAAHAYLPHNTFSPFHRYAWGGLVAVAESHRGRGLGNYINARMIVSAFRELDATHIYELVSTSNVASRRMVEACGLRLEPGLVCGAATRNGSARFTR